MLCTKSRWLSCMSRLGIIHKHMAGLLKALNGMLIIPSWLTFPILQDAYITSKTLFESKTSSWYGSIHTILEQIPEIKHFVQFCIKLSSFKNKAKIDLKSKCIELWKDQMLQQTNGKLKTYITFKSNFGREKYLSVLKGFEQRRCFTQLSISCHQLKIETGRYQGTLRQDRKCERCSSGEVEDEYHFLFHCN